MSEWIDVEDRLPTETGDYLCMVTDDREDEPDGEWPEVVGFIVFEAFDNRFECINFDRVVSWLPIPPTKG